MEDPWRKSLRQCHKNNNMVLFRTTKPSQRKILLKSSKSPGVSKIWNWFVPLIRPSTFIKAKRRASQINAGKSWDDHIIEICKLVKLNYHKTQWDGQNDQVFRLILTISGRNHKSSQIAFRSHWKQTYFENYTTCHIWQKKINRK